MTISEVIQKARLVSDRAGVCFERNAVLSRSKGMFEEKSEDLIRAIESGMNEKFMMVEVGRGPLDFVKNQTGRLIKIVEKDVSDIPPSEELYAFVFLKESSARIEFPSSLNYCKRRFAVMKELSHLLLSTREGDGKCDAISSIVEARRARREVPSEKNAELSEEAAAFYLALEVLVPWRFRRQVWHIKDYLLNHGVEFSSYLVAKSFMVPQAFVELFCGDRDDPKTYSGLSYMINREMDS